MPTAEPSPREVALAILVPIHGHVGLAMEALWSAREQDAGVGLHTICVVDGDPDSGLARLLTSFAAAPGNRCSAYWRRNGGLSAARNSAIAIALARFPALQAVFFLDADNRLAADALGPAMRRLARGEADILYPDLTNFGLRSAQDTAGRFSLAALLRGNYIEAGSLVSARVLRAGLRFDETLREGYEDWAFWLSAARAGFRLAHEPSLGLRYRRRPESMLANTGRHSARLRAGIEAAHADLFAGAGRRRIEACDEPRFALVHVDGDLVELSSDLGRGGERIDIAEWGRRLHLHRAAPTWTHAPPVVCFAAGRTIEALRADGLLPGLVWRLLAAGEGATCRLVADAGSGLELVPETGGAAHVLLVSRSALAATAKTQDRRRAGRVRLAMSGPRSLDLDDDGVEAAADAIIRDWMDMELAASAAVPWSWRGSVEPRRPVDAPDNAFPAPSDGRRHVGLVHAAAGTAAQELREGAEALAAAGFVPHLLARGAVPADLPGAFETTSLLPAEPKLGDRPSAADRYYCGAAIDRPDGRPLAAFGWLDAVVVFALKDALPSLGELRAGGTLTMVASNEPDEPRQPLRRDGDLAYLLAAYEHAIDAFLVGRDGARWLTAMGIPRGKIVASEPPSRAAALVVTIERCCAKKHRTGASAA